MNASTRDQVAGQERSKPPRRRGSANRRRGRKAKRAAEAVAAAAAIAAGTQAYASPVRFDNPPGPNHFEWQGGTYASPVWLDIREPAASQPGTPQGLSSIGQFGDGEGYSGLRGSSPTPELQTGGPYGYSVVPAVDMIPTAGLSWSPLGYIYYAGYGSMLPEGQSTYVGFRFDVGYGNQYAWIGVVREDIELDAFAWGYETEPGVPIPIWPEPGTLALLAFGAVAAARRRRGA